MKRIALFCGLCCFVCVLCGQTRSNSYESRLAFERSFYTAAWWTLWEGDTIPARQFREVYVYPPLKFKNNKERNAYYKLIRDVKIVKPKADLIQNILIESYEAMEGMTPKQKEAHLKTLEKDIKKQYTPEMKKLTLSQGKLLIKLIDKQCASSAYDVIRSFLGPVQAGFYQTFAAVFGASLKKEYDAKGDDWLTDRVLTLVMNYQL